MLVARRTITLSLALAVLLGLASPRPIDAAVRKAGSGRRLKKASDGQRRAQEATTTTYIEPNGEIDDIAADQYSYGGSGKGSHLYTIGGKGGSCGGPYQMCCSDPAARCVPGYGCNYDPEIINLDESDLEKDEIVYYPPYTCTPCGGEDEPCCKTSCSTEECESECTKGNTCNLFSNKCETCGTAEGQPCCEGNLCPGSGLACDTSTMMCMECGDVDDICCQGNVCNPNAGGDVFCNTDTTPNKCELCGDLDQLCCPGDVCSSSDHVCNTVTGRCDDCGGLNQACCAGEKCPGSTSAPTDPADQILSCNTDANKCEVCGGDGQKCCPGDLCDGNDVACNTVTGLCARCGVDEGDICCSGNKCPNYENGESDDRLSCNTAAFPPTCQICGEFGGPCCPGEDFPQRCDLDGAFSCNANGRCPDVVDDMGKPPPADSKCQLENGKDGAREMRATGGCAIWTEAGTLDPIDCLCCKGTCNKGPITEDGFTFMYCSGGKMDVDTDCGDIPEGPFPPAPGGTPPDAGAVPCADVTCINDQLCPDPENNCNCNADACN